MQTRQMMIKLAGRAVKMLLLLLGLTFMLSAAAQAATFQVTTTADNGDNQNPTPGSLRAAIIAANATPDTDTITFQIGSGLQTIQPLSQLPAITSPVIIDGTTQPGFSGSPLIELDGSKTANSKGLIITAGNSTVRGLVINRFSFSAIQLSDNGGNVIAGNYIGTNASGTSAFASPNNGTGITILSSNNIIGGTAVADRNIISGNLNASGGFGIDVFATNSEITNNKIIGNYIGTDVSGNLSVKNSTGIRITPKAMGTIVGGATAAERNVIAGNVTNIDLSGKNSKIQGNYIGTKPDGKNAVAGNLHGIFIEVEAQNNLIGGTNAGEGNVIAFASSRGVVVTGNDSFNNAILGNSIHDNSSLGIDLKFDGVTSNDNGDADAGANNLQNYPVLTSVKSDPNNTVIEGTLNSVANMSYRIELFSNKFCHPSGFGEGQSFVAASNVATDAGGNASFSLTVPTASLPGLNFAATATDSANNTSEFSQCKNSTVINPGTIQFGTNFLGVSESVGTVKATVTRTGGSSGAVSVNFATSDLSAVAGQDYVATSGQLNFADGETSKQITVQILNDAIAEPQEAFQITLSNPTGGATLGGQKSINISIGDDDTPKISINDVQVTEGNAGTTNATFTVSLSNASYTTVTVDFATQSDGTATSGADYQPTSGTLTFSAGELSKPLTVLVNGDTTQETNETFFVKLSNNNNALFGNPLGMGTILDDDAPPNQIQFSSASYSVSEADPSGVATITVNRAGDTSIAMTVDYSTSDNSGVTPCQTNGNGIASERCDYATAVGTLHFAAGESSKTIQVPLINDAYQEPDETFTITLGNPQGATLGAISTATVTIQSDDVQLAVSNPIDDQDFFIRQQYIDFLGRVAEPAGFLFWKNRMNNCPPGDICDRTDTSKRFFESDEFQARGFYVYRLYDAVLGRLPKYAEFEPDVARLNGFQTPQEQQQNKDAYLKDFMSRQEFKTLYGQYLNANLSQATDAAGFVNALCQKAGITPASKQGLVDNLQNSLKDPAQTLEDFILTPEISAKGTLYYDRGFITMQYFGYLRRDPDAGGFNFWVGQLIGPNAPHKQDYRFMVGGFLQSDEYRFRFALISAAP